MANIKREKVEVMLIDDLGELLDGPLKTAIYYLSSLPKEYTQKGYSEFRIEQHYEFKWGEEEDERIVVLYGKRLETDTEFNKRKRRKEASCKANKAKKEKREAKERVMYDRLKKKYGE